MPEPYRGRTFSPAEDWHCGDRREFAFRKLREVDALLRELGDEADRDAGAGWLKRLRRRVPLQRSYDLIDAARTVGDAVHALLRDETPRITVRVKSDGYADAELWLYGVCVDGHGDSTGTLSAEDLVMPVARKLAEHLEELRASAEPENPYRLRYDQPTHAIARADGMILKGGLGGMGLGVMWCTGDPEDPEYADVPWDPEQRDGFGKTAADYQR
jgi:hypothetical protein